jgi:hypothetical protein
VKTLAPSVSGHFYWFEGNSKTKQMKKLRLFLICLGSVAILWQNKSFGSSNTVKIVSPANGSTVTSPASLNVELGAQASSVTIYVDNVVNTQAQSVSKVTGSLTLSPGAHTIKATAQFGAHNRSQQLQTSL